MKKIISVIVVIIIAIAFVVIKKKDNTDDLKLKNNKEYIMINRSKNDEKGMLNFDSVTLVNDKVNNYDSLVNNDFSSIMLNPYNNKINVINNLSCDINIYDNKNNAKHINPCLDNKLEDNGIVTLRFSKRFTTALLSAYDQNKIGIFDHDFNLVKVLKIKENLDNVMLMDNNLYYVKNNKQVIQYNLTKNKTKIIYTRKNNKDKLIDIIPTKDKLYIIYFNATKNNYVIGTLSNKVINDVKTLNYQYIPEPDLTYDNNNLILLYNRLEKDGSEDNNLSLIKINENGEIKIIDNLTSKLIGNENSNIIDISSDEILYHDLDKKKYLKLNLQTLKVKNYQLPYDGNKEYYYDFFITFFNKK